MTFRTTLNDTHNHYFANLLWNFVLIFCKRSMRFVFVFISFALLLFLPSFRCSYGRCRCRCCDHHRCRIYRYCYCNSCKNSNIYFMRFFFFFSCFFFFVFFLLFFSYFEYLPCARIFNMFELHTFDF